jgi:hypothetical protein
MSGQAMKVLLVGHCGPDAFALRAAVGSMVPGAEIEQINSRRGLDEAEGAHLLLINRVLDGAFDTESGIDLIREFAARDSGGRPGLVLVSNLQDAQTEAEAAGALPGFGKRELYSDRMRESLESALSG